MFLGSHAPLLRSQRDLLAVLVCAGDKGDAAALQALEPSHRVGGDGGVGAAHVRGCGSGGGWAGQMREWRQQLLRVPL